MWERRGQGDRRGEDRAAASGRVQWRKESSDKANRGWLVDQSASSFAFVAGTRISPQLGERIEMAGEDLMTRKARVTRVADYDAHLSLVACRCEPRMQMA